MTVMEYEQPQKPKEKKDFAPGDVKKLFKGIVRQFFHPNSNALESAFSEVIPTTPEEDAALEKRQEDTRNYVEQQVKGKGKAPSLYHGKNFLGETYRLKDPSGTILFEISDMRHKNVRVDLNPAVTAENARKLLSKMSLPEKEKTRYLDFLDNAEKQYSVRGQLYQGTSLATQSKIPFVSWFMPIPKEEMPVSSYTKKS